LAVNLDRAEHIGFAEIQLGIPDPTQERFAVLEDNRRDRRLR
jgi:hypothetical protein